MSGILTTLCGGLVVIAGWQYRQRDRKSVV